MIFEHTPSFTTDDAERIARELYGRRGSARALTSERDQNFLIDAADGAPALVIKIANGLEQRELLETQQQVMSTLAQRLLPVPRVVCTSDGDGIAEIARESRRHFVWAITHLPGDLLAESTYRPAALLEDLGATIGRLTAALAVIDPTALERDFQWDLSHAADRIATARASITDEALGTAIDATLARVKRHVTPVADTLPRAAIHNDLNDHNILVAGERVSGIVDFGDMLHGWRIADLAIAAAYAMLDAEAPLVILAALVRGAQRECELEERELEVVFELACLRLALSAAIAIDQQRARPDNDYLGVSQPAINRTLPQLARIPHGLAAAVAREAAGLEPVGRSARVREWLRLKASAFASVLPIDVRTEPTVVLDLGVMSSLISGNADENAEPALTRRIAAAMSAADARVAIGRYDEARLIYTAPFFAGPRPESERRTIHIGLDLFADAGTPVHAPLDGVVHAFANNAVLQDYGPVIILRHETDEGDPFFTLYGHLSRRALDGLEVGQRIARGRRFAWLGEPNENVGWTPHLHLQIITDLLGLGTDFPGVAPASARGVWRSLCPDPNLIVGIPPELFPDAPTEGPSTLMARRELLGGNLSIAYRSPVKVERGWMQYLYDDTGRQFVDAYNNVPHVGHCHPRVVRAGQAQMAVLNTNTRYPSDLVNDYASRLRAMLPGALAHGVVYLVNSASEANELALRLARAHTRERDMIVLEAAYHGNTTSLIDISPYKHAGPGGRGAPDWVHVAPLPDDYRGPFKRGDRDAGSKYADRIRELISRVRKHGRGLAGFIAESCPSVGGQIVFPSGYLEAAYAIVRDADGVCIADEVQTGLGRIGTHCWAFEAQRVVPDIVVMGKPLGNADPLAAVVVRREIAESFDNGMEYFSTFGGNQVSCAIGLAVLDVVRDEQLQEHAREIGERLLMGLRRFVDRHELVGDVRGSGLFLGVELVRSRQTLEPADREASYVVNRMRELGILAGTDGPFHNVVKIRPPMPFDAGNADRLVEAFDRILGELTR